MKKEFTDEAAEKLASQILAKPKYRNINIPTATVLSLIDEAAANCKNSKEINKAVEEKLHNIVALYLGEVDYSVFYDRLDEVLAADSRDELLNFSRGLLSKHQSTEERLDDIDTFYDTIFSHTGVPGTVADVACGLHPFALPFMQLPSGAGYYAYDLNEPRIKAIDTYIKKLGYSGGGFHEDILVNPPETEFDTVFFFKEAHRFEKRKKGCLNAFFGSMNTHCLVVSLPVKDLHNVYDLSARHDALIEKAVSGMNWTVSTADHGSERLYFIKK